MIHYFMFQQEMFNIDDTDLKNLCSLDPLLARVGEDSYCDYNHTYMAYIRFTNSRVDGKYHLFQRRLFVHG